MRKLLCALWVGAAFLYGSAGAQEAPKPMPKEQCLMCHGPTFDDLVKKNVKTESESGPVNPHVWIPHAGGPDKQITECRDCHSQHPMPPKPGWKDQDVSLEPCYACHHNYQLKACDSCHAKRGG